jgi:shikimate dehydrogenase
MRLFGIIGNPLTHSFSPEFFELKFQKLKLDCSYKKFELGSASEFQNLLKSHPELEGINVTIPFKSEILPYLDRLDDIAQEIGAVNTIKIEKGISTGYNTDVIGFEETLKSLGIKNGRALILGSGGASKAVKFVLKKNGIGFTMVTRNKDSGDLTYSEIYKSIVAQHNIVINCTPVGMWPDTHLFPNFPYKFLSPNHILIDLIYKPRVSAFLAQGLKRGCRVKNGYQMLVKQAEASWKLWR